MKKNKTLEDFALEYAPIEWVRESEINLSARLAFLAGANHVLADVEELVGAVRAVVKRYDDAVLSRPNHSDLAKGITHGNYHILSAALKAFDARYKDGEVQ